MAFKTFTVGEVASASDVNTYLMKQTLIVCTSGTRPSSPAEGWHIYETDTDLVRLYSGSAWEYGFKQGAGTDFTPTWTTTGTAPSLGNGTINGRYHRVGRMFIYTGVLVWGSTTTGGTGSWDFDLPFTNVGGSVWIGIGGAEANDSSAGVETTGHVKDTATTTVRAFAGGNDVTATAPFTWATADSFRWTFIGEAAS